MPLAFMISLSPLTTMPLPPPADVAHNTKEVTTAPHVVVITEEIAKTNTELKDEQKSDGGAVAKKMGHLFASASEEELVAWAASGSPKMVAAIWTYIDASAGQN